MTFSIIIPVYNVAPYLRECLDSVLAAVAELERRVGERRDQVSVEKQSSTVQPSTSNLQPRFNLQPSTSLQPSTFNHQPASVEIICVDDGSTDGSGEILDAWVDEQNGRDKRVPPGLLQPSTSNLQPHSYNLQPAFRVIHQKNAGVSAARNAALEVAKGEWIMFVDADDCVQPNVLARSIAAIEKSPDADLLSIQLRRFESDIPEVDESDIADRVVDISRRIPYAVDENGFWQFIYRKSLIADLRFPPYVMGEDRLFKTWALVRARKLVQMNGVAYCYRCRAGSAIESQETWRKWHDDMCHSLRRLWALFWCRKHVEWRIYRHQYGLILRMLQRLYRVKFKG